MFSTTYLEATEAPATVHRRGVLRVLDHAIGAFHATHRQNGHFLSARIWIWFSGKDPLAMAGLNDPDIKLAFGFRRCEVNAQKEDLMRHPAASSDCKIFITYTSRVTGERIELKELLEDAKLDLRALDAFLEAAAVASLGSEEPAEPAGRA